MKNQEIAQVLYEIADLLEIKGEMVFKVRAYRKAAQSVESLPRDIEDIVREGKLDDIPGVGEGIAKKIEEYVNTGRISYLEKIKKGMPSGLEDILSLEGIGPKKVKIFYDKLKIKNLKELEIAARHGKLRKVPGFGKKTEDNILKSIDSANKRGGRMHLDYALLIADEVVSELRKNRNVEKINVAGSLRRMKETIGDIDILVSSRKPKNVVDYFSRLKDVSRILATGPTKSSVEMKNGLQVDLRVLPEKEYGSALLYFTGSKEHNIELRKISIAKKMKLSEYGLFKGSRFMAGRSEKGVYRKLGMQYIEPEMRENRGEIELAKRGKLPKLIGYSDVRGDLQMHTKWSDGSNTIEEMAAAAEKLNYKYICITDHIGSLAIANALNKKRLEKQRKEIDIASKKTGMTILQGGEVDIRADGRLDVDNPTLKSLDVVLASLHSSLKASEERNTKRIVSAMENPHVDVIAHLTGRLINKRDPSNLDIEKIIRKAKETGTVLEIDAQPNRLDLNDVNAKAAAEAGVMLLIDTDSHNTGQLGNMRVGIATARRAWATKKDVINTRSLEKMLKCLK